MLIATYNANSIRARLPIILDWLQSQQPDLFCVQETKVQDSEFPLADIQAAGYQAVFCGQKAHAGVSILSRAPLQDVSCGLDDGEEPDTARLITARLGDICIINTYIPQGQTTESPQFAYKLRWLERLQALFARRFRPDQPVVWVGDFNVAPAPHDVHDPKRLEKHVDFHPLVREKLESIRTWGWNDLIRQHHPDEAIYTFWDYRVPRSLERGLGWRIDHIWASAPAAQRCRRAWVDLAPRQAERPSDHTVVAAEFDA